MATSGNYYEGSSVFTSLSSIFGNPTSGNTAESVPVSSSVVSKAEGLLKKEFFHLPVWTWILIAVAVLVLVFVVM